MHGPAVLAAIVTPVYLTMQMQNTQRVYARTSRCRTSWSSRSSFSSFRAEPARRCRSRGCFAVSRVPRLRRVGRADHPARALQSQRTAALCRAGRLQSAFDRCRSSRARSCWRPSRTAVVAGGLVARAALYIPSSIPTFVSTYLATHDLRAIALAALNIAHRGDYLLSLRARVRAPPEGRSMIARTLRTFWHRRARSRCGAASRRNDAVARAYPAQRASPLSVLEAFLAEGIAESDSRRNDRLRLRRRGSRALRIAAGARPRRRARARAALDRQRYARHRRGAGGLHAAVAERCSRSRARPYDTLRNAICDAPYSLVVHEGIALSRGFAARRRRHRPRRRRSGANARRRYRFRPAVARLRAAARAFGRTNAKRPTRSQTRWRPAAMRPRR